MFKGLDKVTPEGRRFFAQLETLKNQAVYVGFHSDENRPAAVRNSDGSISDSSTMTILEVAAINELGSGNTPPRPFLRKTINEDKSLIQAFSAKEARKLLNGGSSEQMLKRIGVYTKGLVQQKIRDGDFAPNAPSTIKRKGSDKPLIDTGRMRQSVTYIIKQKGGK